MSLSETSPGRKVSREIIRNKKYEWEKMLGYISNSLEDSTLEIHLQSPVCSTVSQVPLWSMEYLNKKSSKGGYEEGELREIPLSRGILAENIGSNDGDHCFSQKILIWIYVPYFTLPCLPTHMPPINKIKFKKL